MMCRALRRSPMAATSYYVYT